MPSLSRFTIKQQHYHSVWCSPQADDKMGAVFKNLRNLAITSTATTVNSNNQHLEFFGLIFSVTTSLQAQQTSWQQGKWYRKNGNPLGGSTVWNQSCATAFGTFARFVKFRLCELHRFGRRWSSMRVRGISTSWSSQEIPSILQGTDQHWLWDKWGSCLPCLESLEEAIAEGHMTAKPWRNMSSAPLHVIFCHCQVPPIHQASEQKDHGEIQSKLGMVNY